MIVGDPDGVPVLTLGDTAIVGGYLVVGYDEGQRRWRRTTVTSTRVDGEFDVASALGRTILTLEVFIEGSDWAQIRTRHRALLDAVEVQGWLLDVDGSVVWRCEKADSSSPIPGRAGDADGRFVTLTIPAQPGYGY